MRSIRRRARADRGTFIHAAIGDFTQRFADGLPADPARELVALGAKHFAALEDFPEARAFWWPRFLRIARWFAHWEAAPAAAIWRARTPKSAAKSKFRSTPARSRCRGVADRIERRSDGRYAILDYKTGSARTEKQVRTGLAPQLTLEAAMLRQGGFSRHRRRRLGRRNRLCHAQGRRAAGQTERRSNSKERHAGLAGRPRAGKTHGAGAAVRGRRRALSLARPSDVDDALRRLRPSRPGQGMVGDRRRRRRGGGGE